MRLEKLFCPIMCCALTALQRPHNQISDSNLDEKILLPKVYGRFLWFYETIWVWADNCCLDKRKMELKYDCIQYDGNSYWVCRDIQYLVFIKKSASRELALWLTPDFDP